MTLSTTPTPTSTDRSRIQSLINFAREKGLQRAMHRAERDAGSIEDLAKAIRRAQLLRDAGADALAGPFTARVEALRRLELSHGIDPSPTDHRGLSGPDADA